MTFLGGVLSFLFCPPPYSFLFHSNSICFWTFPAQSPQGISKTIRKRSQRVVSQEGWFGRMFPGPPEPEWGYKERTDRPPKPEREHKKRNDGAKTWTKAHSPKPPFYKAALLFPLDWLLRMSAAAFWGFSRGGFPENACIGGAISERNFCEICRRKSPQNTEKHKTKLCTEVPERPLPKDPFFQLLSMSTFIATRWMQRGQLNSVPWGPPSPEIMADEQALYHLLLLTAFFSTLLFQPQTVTPHKQHTPIEHLARGRLWVDSWSIFAQFRSKMTKTDQKPTQNWPSPRSRQASTPKTRGGSVAEIKVSTFFSFSLVSSSGPPPFAIPFTPFCSLLCWPPDKKRHSSCKRLSLQ